MKLTFQDTKVANASDLFGWEQQERFAPMKWWAEQLRIVANESQTSAENWALIGRAALLINDSEAYSKAIISLLSRESGYEICEISHDKVFETFAKGFSEVEKPTMFVIPLGMWSAPCELHPNAEEIQAFHKSFPGILEEIPQDKKLAFVGYGDDIRQVTRDLKLAGAFDRKFYVEEPSLYEQGVTFIGLLPKEICGESLYVNPEIIGQVIECEAQSEKRAQLIVLGLKRLAFKEQRKVEFIDLVSLALHGTGEFMPNGGSNLPKRQIALHEAGHALVSILDSNGLNIPDYAGIVQSAGSMGQVSASFEYLAGVPSAGSYKFKRHLVRVLLAGRAAEQIEFGIEGMSVTSSRGDLRHASSVARDLVGRFGVSPTFEDETTAGTNLFVIDDDDPSPSERNRIEKYASQFLERQYETVLKLIRSNKPFLHALTDSIAISSVLKKDDLRRLAIEHGLLSVR